MDNVVTLNTKGTHLYPGAKLTANVSVPTQGSATEVIILFSDFSRAEGHLKPDSGRFRLQVESYVTGAGTTIDRKAWAVDLSGDRDLSVKSKLLWLPSMKPRGA